VAERPAEGGTADEDRAQRPVVRAAAVGRGRNAHVVPAGHDARDAGRAACPPTAEATEQIAVMQVAVFPRRTTSSIAAGIRHDPYP